MNPSTTQASSSDVNQAKREVARAERLLSTRLHEAGRAGDRTLTHALSVARPLLIGAATVAGVVWLVSLLRRPRRQAFLPPAPVRPSIVKEAFRAAALSLATSAAHRMGEHFLLGANAAQSTSTGRAAPPQQP
jgi:hypothetical protein